ncbi:hypothetical protein KV697_10735 [Sphingomonas sanguinis]|uniref:hypothetical protein n=1 Tax=Sphingomonas sanguinis TaxID=33051 RepID=UPI001C592EAC|nr:hypothetical protein [Sphingomonas sanguinis]QXT34310.1 hypothetical protein KV697_10735 [Sphingomonas sanguinis]
MTYARDPLTFEAALDMIVDRLGPSAVAALVERAGRTIRDWSNPHFPLTPPIDAALALDCAWRASGGVGAPMLDTYRRLFDASAPATIAVGNLTLTEATVACIKEGAEAEAALVLAMLPNATRHDRMAATREVAESIAAHEATLMILVAQQPP